MSEMENFLGRSKSTIENKAWKIGLKKLLFRWTTDLFQEFLDKEFGKEFIVLSEFLAVGKDILIKHVTCNNEWITQPTKFIYQKNKCPFCSKTRRLSQSEFEERVLEKSPNLKITGSYKNMSTSVPVSCEKCGYKWNARPQSLINIENHCPQCNNYKIRTQEEFIRDIKLANENIIILEEVKKSKDKILVKCKIDGYQWETTPDRIIRGVGCPKCKNVAKPTTEEFRNRIKEINPEILILGEYTNHYGKMLVKCLNDGNEWEASPHTLLNGIGCPVCSSSKGEKACSKLLESYCFKYTSQFSFKNLVSDSGNPLRFDFCVFKNKEILFLIEVDGVGHIKPIKFRGMSDADAQRKFELIVYHDSLKDSYCIKNGIKLIRLYYTGKNIKDIIRKLEEEIARI